MSSNPFPSFITPYSPPYVNAFAIRPVFGVPRVQTDRRMIRVSDNHFSRKYPVHPSAAATVGRAKALRQGDGTHYSTRPSSRAKHSAANMNRRAHETLPSMRDPVASRGRILRHQTVSAVKLIRRLTRPDRLRRSAGSFGLGPYNRSATSPLRKPAHGVFTTQHGLKQGLIVA